MAGSSAAAASVASRVRRTAARTARAARSGDETGGAMSGTHREWLAPRVLLVDSITQLEAADAGAVVVSGSHGGVSSARYALAVPARLVVFNDAGIGKDEAGVAALALLQTAGRAALAVAHDSARIGDARDTWTHGLVSRANGAAQALGIAVGDTVQAAARKARGPAGAGP
jgi:hypothetical protein